MTVLRLERAGPGFIQPGQRALIHVDAYDVDLNGTAVGVPAATAATFAIIQPDNATGNPTKIVQRLPVQIVIVPNQPLTRLLSGGLSGEAAIEKGFANVLRKQTWAALIKLTFHSVPLMRTV